MVGKRSWFDMINLLILSCACLMVIVPFMYIISISLTPAHILHELGTFPLFPKAITLEAYKLVLEMPQIRQSFLISTFLVVIGTSCNLLFTILLAYPLSKAYLKGRSGFLLLIVFTMLFSGGMIPTYLVVKQAGLINSIWALIVPSLISAFNLLIIKQNFESIPKELEESAFMDGANDFRVLWNIYVPVSIPAFAAVGLFYAVVHWNDLFSGILYISDGKKFPLQVVLYHLLNTATQLTNLDDISGLSETNNNYHPDSLRMALVIVATLPMLFVYPFIQKHFVKGMLTGSIKG